MTQEHPITPPPDLVQQWWDGTHGAFYEFEAVVTQAARWGADMELEACCDSLQELWAPSDWITSLRTARRPKPPSLKKQALKALEDMLRGYSTESAAETIRCFIKSLPDES